MAITPTLGGSLSLAVQGRSAVTVSTLLMSSVLLAVLNIQQGNKPDEVLGLGMPSAQNVISGVKISPTKMKMLDQLQYSPINRAIDQRDFKVMAYRDAPPTPSVMGQSATFTQTVVNGVCTGVTVTGAGTGYTGSPPTLVLVDAAGSCGYGAVLIPTMSAGTFSSVSVANSGGGNGGQGYATTGTTVLVNAGNSAGTMYDRSLFSYCEVKHMGSLYYRDVDAAVALLKEAVTLQEGPEISLLKDEISQTIGNQSSWLADQIWYGVPADQTQPIWTAPAGLLSAIDDGNTYGGIDRTVLANYWWKAKKDTAAHTFSLQDLINDANFKKGLAFMGGDMQGGPDIYIVDPQLFTKFVGQATASTQIVDLCQNGSLKQFGETGFKAMALKFGNVWCIPDQRCPVGTVLGLNSKTILVAFKSGKKFTPSKIYDAAGLLANAFEGQFFYITTQVMVVVEAPALNVKFTNVS